MTNPTNPFEVKARFRLDANGLPESITTTKKGKTLPAYRIALIVRPSTTTVPIQNVTFFLDPSYYDSVREARKQEDGSFEVEITSYGDYTLVAQVQSDGLMRAETAKLSDLLKRGHEADLAQAQA